MNRNPAIASAPPASPAKPRAPARAARDHRARWLAHGFTAAALLAWFIASLFVPPYQFPGPVAVAARMMAFVVDPTLNVELLTTLGHVLAALALSFAIGSTLAVTAFYLRPLRLLIDNRFTPFVNAFPGIGWLFLGILWVGVNSATVIFAVTAILVPFTIINVRAGLRQVDLDLIEMARSHTRVWRRQFAKIVVPMLVPFLFSSLRISFGVAWKVVLTAELFGGSAGVGYLLNVARQEFDTATIFAVIGFIILFVYSADQLFFAPIQARLQRRFTT